MPATLITFAQRSVSSAMNRPKSAAVPPGTTPPMSMMRCLMLGWASASLACLWGSATMSAGTFFGATRPLQPMCDLRGARRRVSTSTALLWGPLHLEDAAHDRAVGGTRAGSAVSHLGRVAARALPRPKNAGIYAQSTVG